MTAIFAGALIESKEEHQQIVKLIEDLTHTDDTDNTLSEAAY